MDGVNYTWDENGNLISDGVNTYTLDHADRLVAVNGLQTAVSYTYNGLGDRIQQTTGGVTTNYTLDLNVGLTQVLQDGEITYLYGNGRIAQVGATSTEYFLGDALGSVRQLVDANENVTLTKSYQPYGEALSSIGSGISSYGFTSEWTDSLTAMVYLRARWYATEMGRFISRDTWQGDYNTPMS